MESKIQQLVNELSKNKRVQSVIQEVHVLQGKLNSEMTKTLSRFKKSAGDIEKNVLKYKKQLVTQKNKIEKELRAKAKTLQAQTTKPARKKTAKKATATKKTTARKTSKKRA